MHIVEATEKTGEIMTPANSVPLTLLESMKLNSHGVMGRFAHMRHENRLNEINREGLLQVAQEHVRQRVGLMVSKGELLAAHERSLAMREFVEGSSQLMNELADQLGNFFKDLSDHQSRAMVEAFQDCKGKCEEFEKLHQDGAITEDAKTLLIAETEKARDKLLEKTRERVAMFEEEFDRKIRDTISTTARIAANAQNVD